MSHRNRQWMADQERILRACLASVRDQLADLDRTPAHQLPELTAGLMATARLAERTVLQGGFDRPAGPVSR